MLAEIENKRQHPFDSIVMSKDNIIHTNSSALDHLNSLIAKQNEITNNHARNSNSAGNKLELSIVGDGLETFRRLNTIVKTYEGMTASLSRSAAATRSKINGLQSEMTEHYRPADELNYDLRSYLGHNELQLEIGENGYILTRNGMPALQPSEGEITAIALLYFLKSLMDHGLTSKMVCGVRRPNLEPRRNSLFLAFGFIQERTKDTGQLFVFHT